MKIIRKLKSLPLPVLAAILIVGCGGVALAGKPAYQKAMELETNQLAEQMDKAVGYPKDEMRDSLERRQLRERLLRFNKPSKIGYIYIFNLGVKEPIGYYVVKGKVSSVQSSMLNPTQTWKEDCGTDCDYGMSAESMGDDGSFGNNECGDQGVFFFDATDAMHELCEVSWHYSDVPITIWKDTPKLGG